MRSKTPRTDRVLKALEMLPDSLKCGALIQHARSLEEAYSKTLLDLDEAQCVANELRDKYRLEEKFQWDDDEEPEPDYYKAWRESQLED